MNLSLVSLRRRTIFLILIVLSLGGIIATVLHDYSPQTHPISLVIPPLTAVICFGQLIYLIYHPNRIEFIIQITLIWGAVINIFPEYFFVIVSWLTPGTQLIHTLPPITPGLFLLNMGMIVFLRPSHLIHFALLLWAVTAVPILSYLISHPVELQHPRGLELLMTLGPAMGVNLALIVFYVRLQAAVDHLQREELRLQKVSEIDPLTQLWNRRAGERILRELIEQNPLGLGIILCDIDYFKSVNDTYGHLVGDHVLQIFTQWCRQHIRPQDVMVRWGGEEFMVIGRVDEPAEIALLAERLCQGIAQQSIPEVERITASFGVAFYQPPETIIDLFDRADTALYQAKQQGRNRVVVNA